MNLVVSCSFAEKFCHNKDTAVIYDSDTLQQFFLGTVCITADIQAVDMLLQGTECLHKSTFKVITDTHNLSCCLHLGCKSSLGLDKFIKWKSRNLNNTVIQCWLKTCISFAGNGIWNLIQSITKSNLCSNFCNRITGCFGSQCGRTAYTRVYFDNTVFKTFRMKCKLNITTTGNI